MPNELIFELGDVRITPYIAQFGGTSYQIASIGSVRIVRGKKINPLAVIVFILGGGILAIAMARSSGSPELADANFPFAVAGASVMLAAFLLQLARPGRLYKLLLRIHSVDVEALSSTRAKFVADVKQAIEAAFIARSQRHDEKTSG